MYQICIKYRCAFTSVHPAPGNATKFTQLPPLSADGQNQPGRVELKPGTLRDALRYVR